MNRYELQAERFLKKTNTTLSIKFDYCGPHFGDNDTSRNNYKCVLKNIKGQYTINFGNSIQNTIDGVAPTKYDILACLTKYGPGTFEDFCGEYGYDYEEKESEKIYRGCIKEFKGLSRIFTDEQMEMLANIY